MPRPRPSRRTQRPAPPAGRPAPPVAPADRPTFRTAWASADADPQGVEAAIGKVARFGDAPRVGRVRDVIFELATGEILAYEVDPGDGSACFVAAEMLERATPSTLHFAGASRAPFGGEGEAGEFMVHEHLPGDDAKRPPRSI